jgi:glycosyltransferase involved in cell wall biosynthesis
VFEQTIAVDEVVLVDDGSVDQTRDVVESLISQHPGWRSRLQYLRQENQGKSVALNRALAIAKGDWIAYLDSDDCWLPDKLDWQFRALQEYPDCRACFTETSLLEFRATKETDPDRFAQREGPIGKVFDPSWLYVRKFPGTYMQTVIVRRDAMLECGEFDARLRMGQDADFLFRLGLVTDFCYVDVALVDVSRDPRRAGLVGEGNRFRSLPRVQAQEIRLRTWLTLVASSRPDMSRCIRRELASQRSELANRLLIANDLLSTRQVLQAAMRECLEVRILIKWLLAWAAPAMLREFVKRRVAPDLASAGNGH